VQVVQTVQDEDIVDFGETIPDGECTLHFLSGKDDLMKDPKHENLVFNQDRRDKTVARIVNNICEIRIAVVAGLGDDHSDADVKKGMVELLGEDPEEFVNKLTHNARNDPDQAGRQSGISEIAVHDYKSPVMTVMIDADNINSGMSMKQVQQNTHHMTLPGDTPDGGDKTHVVCAVRVRGPHIMYGLINGKAIFEIGEWSRAVEKIQEAVLRDAPPPSMSQESLSKISDSNERNAAILESIKAQRKSLLVPKILNKSQTAKAKPLIKKKLPSVTPPEAEPDVDYGWQKVTPRNRKVGLKVTFAKKPDAKKPQQELVNSIVIWTTMKANDFSGGIKARAPEVASLIQVVRQKTGHLVLMSSEQNDRKLRCQLDSFANIGLNAKLYRYKEGLADQSEKGANRSVNKAGICDFRFAEKKCPRGSDCPYMCYDAT
jgi:hypothetical protein